MVSATHFRLPDKIKDTFSARVIRQHTDSNMLWIGARIVGEGLTLDIVDAFFGRPGFTGRLVEARDVVESFHYVLRRKSEDDLEAWIDRATASLVASSVTKRLFRMR